MIQPLIRNLDFPQSIIWFNQTILKASFFHFSNDHIIELITAISVKSAIAQSLFVWLFYQLQAIRLIAQPVLTLDPVSPNVSAL